MRNLLIVFCIGCIMASCTSTAPTGNSFGAKISAENALSVTELEEAMAGKTELKSRVTGTVEAVCQVKGCWMTLEKPNGESMRITFKDYGFFVPMDIMGKKVTAEGVASVVTTSVADLKHYAEDEGLSAQEIAKITEPEHELVFVADGVIVQ